MAICIDAISAALADLQANAGKEGYRHAFDRALHIYTRLHHTPGIRIIRSNKNLQSPRGVAPDKASQPLAANDGGAASDGGKAKPRPERGGCPSETGDKGRVDESARTSVGRE